MITAKDGETEGSSFGLLESVNVVVLIGSLAMLAWTLLRVTPSV